VGVAIWVIPSFLTVKRWQVASVCVSVSGEQTHRGEVTHWLHVGGEDQFNNSDRRPLMNSLTDAGKLLDSLG
jgi:hypothetical protein